MRTGKGVPKTLQVTNPILDVPQVKYPKPKVLLLDVAEAIVEPLITKGFNVSVGTFGTPYKVPKGDGYHPVIGKADLPNYTEQEIVVVDLHVGDFDNGPNGEKHRPNGELDLWAKVDRGIIDPRPRAACQVCDSFNRTLESGGVFVVFADARTGIELVVARKQGWSGGRLYDEKPFPRDVWNFIDELGDIRVQDDHGQEMYASDNSVLGQLLARHLEGGQFLCTLDGGYRREDPWVTLAENKFGQPVAICRCRGSKGTVIVVPQIANKGDFLESLFANVLPEIAPHLFPYIEQGKWIHQREYELPRILEIKKRQKEIELQAREEIEALEGELDRERATNGWIHDLLTGTDSVLVDAVKKALRSLGFSQIVDVDEERDAEGKSRREDLQIRDSSPILIVDVKGIGGYPGDADVLQADKHAAIRMREEKRTDIIGLSIINHQRHLPPLDRENAMPFRQELLDAAEERTLSLLTAWDLYRFARNATRLCWKAEQVVPLFYSKGRIHVVPIHYEFLGVVAKAWTDKFGIVMNKSELRVGDRIAVEFPIEFEEIQVDSIRVNDQSVEVASVGDPAGLLWPVSAPKLKEGMRVFRVVDLE